MPRYIALMNWTEQGIKTVKDSPKRLDAAKELAKRMKGEIVDFYMTTGAHDMVVVFDLPDDETMAKFILAVGMGGNIRSTTLRAFSEDAYRRITSQM